MSIFHEFEKEFQMALSFLKWVLFVMQYMHGHWAFGKSRYFPVKARALICNFPSLCPKYKNRLRVLLAKKPIRNIEKNVTVHSLWGSISAECFTVTPRTLEVEGGGAQVLCCGYQLNIVSVWKTLRLLKVVLWNHQGPLRKEN